MRWDRDHESPDLIDRRGERAAGGGGGMGGLLSLLPFLLRSKFGWLILLLLGGYWVFQQFVGGGGTASRVQGDAPPRAAGADPQAEVVHFVSFVLDDNQETWERVLTAERKPYRHAKLVLFNDATRTGCGYGDAATGPFYCPADERVYIDLGFFRELSTRFGARGEFAEAYVIAHEVGHHVQKVLGISESAQALRGPQRGATSSSVKLELQADCFAGIWAHSTGKRNLLESGDIASALTAAEAIGDDRLQRQSTGTVSPEKWTHGSSEERMTWFKRGYEKGEIDACNTFAPGAVR
jgi:predicted metalloprotease